MSQVKDKYTPDEAVTLFLEGLKSTNPPPQVADVIAKIQKETTGAPALKASRRRGKRKHRA